MSALKSRLMRPAFAGLLAFTSLTALATPASAVVAFTPFFQNLSFFTSAEINSGIIGYTGSFVNSFYVPASNDGPSTIQDPFKHTVPFSQMYFAGIVYEFDALAEQSLAPAPSNAHLILALNNAFVLDHLEGDPFEDDFTSVTETDLISALYTLDGHAADQGEIDTAVNTIFTFQDELFNLNAGFGSTDNFTLVRYSLGTIAGSGFGSQTLAAVPEPATWAMMIAGFGLIGAAARRRNTSVAVSYS